MTDKYLSGIFWNHLVYPEFAAGEIEDTDTLKKWLGQQIENENWPEYAAVLSIDNLFSKNDRERSDLITRVREKLSALLKPHQRRLLGFAHKNSIYFCGDGIPDAKLHYFFEKFRRQISSETGADITIGVAKLQTLSLAGMQWAAQRAVVAQRQKVRDGINRVYIHDNAELPVPSLAIYWRLALNLQEKMRAGHTDATADITTDICREIFRGTYLSLHKLRPVLQSLIILTAQAATDAGVDEMQTAAATEEILSAISDEFDYMNLEYIIKSGISRYSGLIANMYNSKQQQMASLIDEIIDLNIDNNDLSLNFIAQNLKLSPSYISRKYHETRGISLTTSINQKRVQLAIKLLRQNKSVTDTAFAAGFGTVQHFNRVFKKNIGMSPVKYRGNLRQ